jgi:hypothetical protein
MENGEPGPPRPIERTNDLCSGKGRDYLVGSIIDVEKKLGVVFAASSFALFRFLLDALTAKQFRW